MLLQAKERIEELEAAIHNCEQFDSSLTECQAWCNHVQLILSCRAANDVSALDVPHEYKVSCKLITYKLRFLLLILICDKVEMHEGLCVLIFSQQNFWQDRCIIQNASRNTDLYQKNFENLSLYFEHIT